MLAASTLDVLDAQPMDRSDSWCKPTSVSTIISMRTSACDQALAQGSARRQSVRGLCDVQTRHGKSHLPRSTNLPGRCTRSIRGRSIYRFGRSIYQRSTIYPIYPIYPVDGRWFSPQLRPRTVAASSSASCRPAACAALTPSPDATPQRL